MRMFKQQKHPTDNSDMNDDAIIKILKCPFIVHFPFELFFGK